MDGRYIYAHIHARSGTDTGQIQKPYNTTTAEINNSTTKQLQQTKQISETITATTTAGAGTTKSELNKLNASTG